MSYLLSVLVCTIDERAEEFLPRLISSLMKQYKDKPVQILYLGDNKTMKVGEKRNHLTQLAKGKFSVCFDDDDLPSEDYIDSLLNAIYENPDADCIAFDAFRYHNGKEDRLVKYDKLYERDRDDSIFYMRIPNHICCFRTELLKETPYLHVDFAEDVTFSRQIRPKIKKQVRIDKILYYYFFDSKNTRTQQHLYAD